MAKIKNVDSNIVKKLNQLIIPFKTNNGEKVVFADKGRYGTRFEHIADKKHHLTIRDIDLIPYILLNPFAVRKSKKVGSTVCYFGKRKGVNKKQYLKIVIDFRNEKEGKIVTIYPTKTIDKS